MSGSIASLVSAAALALLSRGGREAAAGPINDVSHWVWGNRGIGHARPSWRHSAVGLLIHHASSVFWALGFEWLVARRRSPAAAAAGVAALAYGVDFGIVPHRLSPGFQHRLSARRRVVAYTAFALALLGTARVRGHLSARKPGRRVRR